MASSEVQQTFPTNGHAHPAEDADNSEPCGAEHEDITGSSTAEPTDRPEHIPETTTLEDAGATQHEKPRSSQPEETAVSPAPVSDNPPAGQSAASSKLKPTSSPSKRPIPTVQTTATKGTSGPPTPQVKKILSSGKFGTGVAKAVPPPIPKSTDTPIVSSKPSTQASSTLKPTPSSNPPLKKSPVSTSAPSSKATMPPKPSTTTPSIPAPTRRTSLAPPKFTAPSAKSGTLSASTSGKLSSATSSSAVKSSVPQRTSLVSPDSTASAKSATTSRPRVPVSEGATQKRAAAPRASLAPSAKQPATSTARPARSSGTGSISSFKDVKEVKERGTDVVEIQSKLAEATASLDLKTSAISLLETEVEKLKASLDSITADLEAVQGNLGNAELAKAAADKELADTKAALVASQGDGGKLEQVSEELEAARTASAKRDAIIETLQEQAKALQTEVDESRRALEALRADHANNSDLMATAEMDRQALLKARADLEAIETETSALKVAQTEVLDAATAKINTLQDQASRAEALAAEIDSLHAGKEETSSKLSELEIEILELKDAREQEEEERGKREAQIDALHGRVAAAGAAADKAVQEAAAKESAVALHLEEVKKQHEAALALVVEESKQLTEQLRTYQAKIDELHNNLGDVNAAAANAAAEHARHFAEAQQAHQTRQDELAAEIEKISAELAAQEAVYDAKVQKVRDEHDQLLQEAFERAKNDASEVHGQDLQTLREKSEAATEQLRSSHHTTVEGLKAEHQDKLASEAQAFQKQLSSRELELKATAEDLAKSKATLSTSLQEIETLKAQLDEAHQATVTAAGAAASNKDTEIARLTKELSNVREDLDGLNEVFRATQESMREMGNNHQKELEEAAKGRAEEVSKLRATHDTEIQSLVSDKADLLTRLSDLEGEMHTLRASAPPTETVASPKRNGQATVPAETVTKEELQRMHEAHNLKLNDAQAQHDKEIRAFQEQIEAAIARAGEAEQDLERKKMEIMYLEQDQEESQDEITRLKEDVVRLTEKLPSNTE